MRTVSFSQPQVQQTLSRDFVCFTTSTEGDPTAGQSIRHRPKDPAGPCIRGNGQQNVQTLFLTPDGKIFHAATGYLSPEDLMTELEYARELFAELQQSPTETHADLVKSRHRQRLEQLNFSADEIDSSGANFAMGMNVPAMLQNPNSLKSLMTGAFEPGPGGPGRPGDPKSVNEVFAAFNRRQILSDHKYCIDCPLQPSVVFHRDPTPLVGSGKSFFMSTSGGSNGR